MLHRVVARDAAAGPAAVEALRVAARLEAKRDAGAALDAQEARALFVARLELGRLDEGEATRGLAKHRLDARARARAETLRFELRLASWVATAAKAKGAQRAKERDAIARKIHAAFRRGRAPRPGTPHVFAFDSLLLRGASLARDRKAFLSRYDGMRARLEAQRAGLEKSARRSPALESILEGTRKALSELEAQKRALDVAAPESSRRNAPPTKKRSNEI